MNEEQVPETRGVTAELLATIDLGPEIEGMAGRQLRMRKFTFEPGAVFGPLHDHKGCTGWRTAGPVWLSRSRWTSSSRKRE